MPSSFHDLRAQRINKMPRVEANLIRSTEAPGGIGGPGTSVFKPALGNTVFAATGLRVRDLPLVAP